MLTFEQYYFGNSEYSNYDRYDHKCYDNLVEKLISTCNVHISDTIIDYGCATGLLLRAFKKRGYCNLIGTDISYWAINQGRKQYGLSSELQHYNRNLLEVPKDWLIMLDVLEHIPTLDELNNMFQLISQSTIRKGFIVRIPVSKHEGEDFYLEVSRNDKTHTQSHSTDWWLRFFKQHNLRLTRFFNEEPYIWNSTGVLAAQLRQQL